MAVQDRLRRWADRVQELPLKHLPPDEHVVINERQHPAVLILKAIRTGSGVGMMLSQPTIGLAFIFGGSIVADTIRDPSYFKRRTVLLLSVLLTVAVFLLGHASPTIRACTAAAILIWLLADLATWFYDRLVVTNRRLYRIHGLLTTHRPSVALQSVTVVDLEMGPASRWFGTLRFDTPAQRDGPLHRFTFVRDAGNVHVQILQLRASAGASPPPGF